MTDHIAEFEAVYFPLNSITPERRVRSVDNLRRFERWLEHPVETSVPGELQGWLASLVESGLQASTVAWRLKMIRPYLRWCWEQRILDADSWMRLREVKAPRGAYHCVPRPYTRKELMKLYAELDARWPYTTEKRVTRWRKGTCQYTRISKGVMRLQLDVIIELALVCGLRQVEIYNLSIDDLHYDNKYVVVHGKRVDQHPKVREVPYPSSLVRAVRAWYKMRGFIGPDTKCVWISATGRDPFRGMTRDRMARLLTSFGAWELHRLRHTSATERLRAGMPLEQVQRIMGHATLAQTMAYAQLLSGDVHKGAERTDAAFQRALGRAA